MAEDLFKEFGLEEELLRNIKEMKKDLCSPESSSTSYNHVTGTLANNLVYEKLVGEDSTNTIKAINDYLTLLVSNPKIAEKEFNGQYDESVDNNEPVKYVNYLTKKHY